MSEKRERKTAAHTLVHRKENYLNLVILKSIIISKDINNYRKI